MLESGQTEVLHDFFSKNNKVFSAVLKLGNNEYEFVFPKKK